MMGALQPPTATMPQGMSEQIAEQALAEAVRDRCRGGSWQGLARELAWRAVTGGHRDARSVDALASYAEALLAQSIDQALWTVEQRAIESFQEFVHDHRGDAERARTAAVLDAAEEAERLIAAAYDRALDALLATTRRAA